MSEQARAAFKWTAMLTVLGVAMLVLFRVAVHSKGVADIVWFLKLVLIQIVIYLAAAWLSLGTKDSRRLIGTVYKATGEEGCNEHNSVIKLYFRTCQT